MKNKKFLKFGILGGVIASMCCWGPLLLISFGVIGTSGALSIGYNSPWFFSVGFSFTVMISIYFIRTRVKQGQCSSKQDITKTIALTLLIIAAMILTTFLLKDVLVPYLAPIVFKR